MTRGEYYMRKELILEDAGSHLEDWREVYVEKLTTQFPKAIVLPMGHTIALSRRGQRVWIGLNKRDSDDVRVVTWTRSTLVPIAIFCLVIAGLFIFSLAASYMSYMSSYYSYYSYSYYSYPYYYSPPSIYYYITPYIPFILIFLGISAGLMKTNKTRVMQASALQLAKDSWLSFRRKVEAKVFPRAVSRPTPPKTTVAPPPEESDRALGNYCMYCGSRVEKTGAKFCESCGKNLSI